MKKHFRTFGLFSTVLMYVAVTGSTAMALPPRAAAHAQAALAATKTTDSSSAAGSRPATADQARLAAGQLKACQNRQKAITAIMTRIDDRGQRQVTLFGTIATRVETFYANKGKTLNNYDALVADVNAKQAAAQTAVATIKSDSTGFSCDGTNPQGFVSSFQSSLKSEIAALQAYRTSVKNLIVGVKSVQGTTSSANDTTAGGEQ